MTFDPEKNSKHPKEVETYDYQQNRRTEVDTDYTTNQENQAKFLTEIAIRKEKMKNDTIYDKLYQDGISRKHKNSIDMQSQLNDRSEIINNDLNCVIQKPIDEQSTVTRRFLPKKDSINLGKTKMPSLTRPDELTVKDAETSTRFEEQKTDSFKEILRQLAPLNVYVPAGQQKFVKLRQKMLKPIPRRSISIFPEHAYRIIDHQILNGGMLSRHRQHSEKQNEG